MSEELRRCFHCGEPVPAGCRLTVEVDGEPQPVCCSGCEAVATLILRSGMSGYYRYRTARAAKPTEQDFEVEASWRRFDQRTSLWGETLGDGCYEMLLQAENVRCAACAWLIRSQLETRDGIDQAQVDVSTGFVRVRWRPGRIRLSRIAGILAGIGYRPHLPLSAGEAFGRQQERRLAMKRLGVAGLGMMQVMMYAVALYAGEASGIAAGPERFLQWVSLLVTTPVVAYSGAAFYSGAWRSLRARQVGMDVPVALAISIAFAASCVNFLRGSGHVYFDSVVMFIFFLSLGRYSELVIRQRNLQTGLALARLQPEWAERLCNGNTEKVPAADLRVGDRFMVRSGQPFPADGRVTRGTTTVNESLLTGESNPVTRKPGDKVIGGSINLTQPVEAEVSANPDESTVSVLGRMLLKSQTHRSRFARVSERYAGWFVALVLLVAAGTALWWLFHDRGLLLPATLAVLVISCPCALSLAAPAAIASSSRKLMEHGVLLTRTPALEALKGVDTVIFDKTGTLTTGSPRLAAIHLNPARVGFTEKGVREIAALLESGTAHPAGRALQMTAATRRSADAIVHHENGVAGRVDGSDYRLGSARFANISPAQQGNEPESAAPSTVWLADGQGWVARFELEDRLRAGVGESIGALKQRGLHIVILSGDQPQAVAAVASRTGIPEWHADRSPQQKMAFLRRLQDSGKQVLMIGDGVNDAPVLSVANVSMTVSGASELANSTADFILTGNSLALVEYVFSSAEATQRVIRQNLAWALGYNLVAVPFAAAGFVLPWMAALGMSLSSLLVVLNSGRLARSRRHSDPVYAVQELRT